MKKTLSISLFLFFSMVIFTKEVLAMPIEPQMCFSEFENKIIYRYLAQLDSIDKKLIKLQEQETIDYSEVLSLKTLKKELEGMLNIVVKRINLIS